jgi:SMC domain protein|nr:MAG TPA: STRUCTURAL MAINTENANCE OF CHROMOSOMES PROTEIN [Caudoviricetes sp.]
MENQVKITLIEIENSKRIKAFKAHPAENGLTVIGGRNGQGKTSVLDGIAWALGGEKYRPSQPQREGALTQPYIHLVLSNGLVVERKGQNSSLKITDPSGRKGGQQILDELVSKLALDLPKFMQMTSKEKARTLLQIIGVEQELAALEQKEKELYNQRLYVGRTADQKKKFALEMPYYPQAPKEPVSASDLIAQQQDILAQNGENQRKRARRDTLAAQAKRLGDQIAQMQAQYDQVIADLEIATRDAKDLMDESTAALEENIRNIEQINVMVRANLDKEKAEEDARNYQEQYEQLTSQIDTVRADQIMLLNGAQMPLDGLTVKDGELMYGGFAWDNLSGSDQLRVATAIVRRLNPQCGFVLLDKLEQMDPDTMAEFGRWLESERLQAIATRVSTGSECSLIIEDGYGMEQEFAQSPKRWEAGRF